MSAEKHDPRLNDLVTTLMRLEDSIRLVREELARQGERTRINAEGVAELRGQDNPTRHYVDVAARAAVQEALAGPVRNLRSDVDTLLAVVKPSGAEGLAEKHAEDRKVLWRWVYGVGGVVAVLGLVGLLAKLPVWGWLTGG